MLDEARHRRPSSEAERRKVSVGSLVPEAIDLAFPPTDDGRRAAAREILNAIPIPVPHPEALCAELAALRGRRG